ncbi:hypothetical protein Chls_874 [Chlamydia suis]|uniref:Uncharacterized protein n=1 Tax=Chlamydia suis TaxID=83559 RepID=A0ABX6IUZ3_9CHLA|nr:hypothetical protein Chls_874 [Chlamydia suis]
MKPRTIFQALFLRFLVWDFLASRKISCVDVAGYIPLPIRSLCLL